MAAEMGEEGGGQPSNKRMDHLVSHADNPSLPATSVSRRVRVTPEDTILGGGIPAVTLTVAAASASASTPSPSTTETELNSLSDEMFTRIAAQAEVLRRKKADREQQLQSLRDVLESLWEVVGAEASDKAALGQTMAAPTRLHMRNLDKVGWDPGLPVRALGWCQERGEVALYLRVPMKGCACHVLAVTGVQFNPWVQLDSVHGSIV